VWKRRSALAVAALTAVALLVLAGRALRPPVRELAPARSTVSPASPADSSGLIRYGRPVGHEADGRLLTKSHHACFHDPHLKVSRWVAYRAEGDDTSSRERHAGKFFPEPQLPAGQRAEEYDYRGLWKPDRTGYDRGHQAPDAAIKRFGPEAQRETYSLANTTPQHSQINQGIWQDVEAAIRSWSAPNRPVWVVTGPIFFPKHETTYVGPNRVAVPDAYYAVLNRGLPPQVLSFLVANTAQAPWYASLNGFLVSVDSVEKLTGLDFLSELPDSAENRLEALTPRTAWP
jgi:endonuclease G